MSDKDYAQARTAQIESKRASQASNPKPMVIASLATVLAIICFSAGYYLGEKYSQENDLSAKHEALLAKLHQQQEENKKLKKEAKRYQEEKKSDSDVGELTFYNKLPNQSIIPEPLDGNKTKLKPLLSNAEKNGEKKHTSAKDSSHENWETEEQLDAIIAKELNSPALKFRLQIASFIEEKDAHTLVERLKEAGIESVVKRVELVNLGTRHRVYTTPFNQQKRALEARQLVQDTFGIKGIIITQ